MSIGLHFKGWKQRSCWWCFQPLFHMQCVEVIFLCLRKHTNNHSICRMHIYNLPIIVIFVCFHKLSMFFLPRMNSIEWKLSCNNIFPLLNTNPMQKSRFNMKTVTTILRQSNHVEKHRISLFISLITFMIYHIHYFFICSSFLNLGVCSVRKYTIWNSTNYFPFKDKRWNKNCKFSNYRVL